MSSNSTREEIKRNTDEDPDVVRLQDAYRETNSDLGSYYTQTGLNYNTRNCIWPGQNLETGRKHGTVDKPAYPWEGASDIRTFTTNSICDENVALLKKSLLRGNLTAVPLEGNDIQRSRMITQYMDYRLHSIPDLDRQAKILGNFQEEKGIGVVGVFWDTKIEDEITTLTIEQLAGIDPENPDIGLQLVAMVMDEEQTKEATTLIMEFFSNISRRKARKIVNELRKTGESSVGVPKIIHNRPIIKALAVGDDVIFAPNVIDLQDAPYIFHSDYMTPEALRSKVLEEGWDEDWVEDVIKTTVGKDPQLNTTRQIKNQYDNTVDDASGFVRITHGYEKATTEDGVIGVFVTAFHPDIPGFGMSQLLDYKPSRYPFVAFPREYISRRLMDSRGVPELGKGAQDEIKVQQDSRVDRTNLTTCPPREHPLGRKLTTYGPGDSVGVRRRGEYGFMEIPSGGVQESIEVEKSVMDNLNRMFGRPVAGEDPQHAIDLMQDSVDQWLRNWVQVMNQVWDLDQQFGEDEQFFRVIGSGDAEAMQFIRSEEAERVDFYFDYNLINADTDKLIENLGVLGDVASKFDRNGRFDYDELLGLIAGSMDSSFPDQLIKPAQQATEEEVRKTQDDISKIASGQVVNAPENANVQLRIQVIQQYLQGTEEIPGHDIQQRYQEDELFKARIDKYVEQLQFQQTQRENAQIGKLGNQPGNSVPSA